VVCTKLGFRGSFILWRSEYWCLGLIFRACLLAFSVQEFGFGIWRWCLGGWLWRLALGMAL
jgi:hypothetical protein